MDSFYVHPSLFELLKRLLEPVTLEPDRRS